MAPFKPKSERTQYKWSYKSEKDKKNKKSKENGRGERGEKGQQGNKVNLKIGKIVVPKQIFIIR